MAEPSDIKFGHKMRQHFLFDENWTNLNHGAFGTYPKNVADVRFNLLRAVERAPDMFLRYDHVTLYNQSCSRLAEYLHVPADEIVLLGNATLAIMTVLRNLTFKDKDVILCLESVYDAVEMTLLSMQETAPQISIHKVDYGKNCTKAEFPQSHDGICECFAKTVAQLEADGFTVKVAVFETISSIPALRLPFERLTRLCKDRGILSLIDGAHGIGQIALDLSALDADFFISNCHKWLYTPRGCAVLHVPKRNQHLVRTAFPTSWEFELRSKDADSPMRFLHQFQMQATADNTPFYCVAAALEFRERFCGGESTIFQYCREVAQKGADIIAQKLGTVVLQEPGLRLRNDYDDGTEILESFTGLRDCAMANVLLPLTIDDTVPIGTSVVTSTNISQVTSWMQKVVPLEYNTSVSFFVYRGRIWVRLSGQIYLELSDFEWFAGVLLDLCRRVEAGEPFAAREQ